MQDPFLGEIMTFAGSYVPYDGSQWVACNGQLLNLNANQALYAVLGVQWGGDGRSTFGVPDLRGRAIIGAGTGPGGMTNRVVGQMSGSETTTLTIATLPNHAHALAATGTTGTGTISKSSITINASSTVNCDSTGAADPNPAGGYPGNDGINPAWSSTYNTTMNANMVQTSAQVANDIPLSLTINMPAQNTTAVGGSSPVSLMQPWACMTYTIAINGLFPPHS